MEKDFLFIKVSSNLERLIQRHENGVLCRKKSLKKGTYLFLFEHLLVQQTYALKNPALVEDLQQFVD